MTHAASKKKTFRSQIFLQKLYHEVDKPYMGGRLLVRDRSPGLSTFVELLLKSFLNALRTFLRFEEFCMIDDPGSATTIGDDLGVR